MTQIRTSLQSRQSYIPWNLELLWNDYIRARFAHEMDHSVHSLLHMQTAFKKFREAFVDAQR